MERRRAPRSIFTSKRRAADNAVAIIALLRHITLPLRCGGQKIGRMGSSAKLVQLGCSARWIRMAGLLFTAGAERSRWSEVHPHVCFARNFPRSNSDFFCSDLSASERVSVFKGNAAWLAVPRIKPTIIKTLGTTPNHSNKASGDSHPKREPARFRARFSVAERNSISIQLGGTLLVKIRSNICAAY